MTKENRNLPDNTYAVYDQHTHRILGFIDANNYHDAYQKAEKYFLFIQPHIDNINITRTIEVIIR